MVCNICRVRTPDELAALFRGQGRKVTPQRQFIFRILHESPSHPTAESVYAAVHQVMPTVSLRTVYQTLNDLADMGELKVLDLGTGATRFDPNHSPHHHLVCTSCGAVRDLTADFGDLAVPRGQEQGFEVGEAEVVFRGRCPGCLSPAREAGTASATTFTTT